MQQLVSVIMPAYNAGKHIAESIQSVLDQTYVSWELIVVDDGSSDNTLDVVREYVSADSRVKYISQRNGGQASARNAGLRIAQGDLVAFLDATIYGRAKNLSCKFSSARLGRRYGFLRRICVLDDGSPERTDFFAVVRAQWTALG